MWEFFTLTGHDFLISIANPVLPVGSEASKEVGKNFEANLNEPPARKCVSCIITTSAPEVLQGDPVFGNGT